MAESELPVGCRQKHLDGLARFKKFQPGDHVLEIPSSQNNSLSLEQLTGNVVRCSACSVFLPSLVLT